MLTAQQFFELSAYSHKQLFDLDAPVWSSLSLLIPYLETKTLGQIEVNVPKESHLVHPKSISIGKGTRIHPNVVIEGPCIIGKHCEIRPGAYIRPYVIIGNHCIVGHCSEIKHSIVLNHSAFPHFNYIGDSIVGSNVNLGAGVVLANTRLDESEILIAYRGEKITTGLKKLGAIVGDGAKLGCNAVTNPGTLLPKNFRCQPCSNLKGAFNEKPKVRI